MLTLETTVFKTATFVCDLKTDAKRVFLTENFNQWQSQTNRITKSKDGSYRAKIKLPQGDYQYKFIVDGMWFNDPRADSQVMNRYGTLNSVIRVV